MSLRPGTMQSYAKKWNLAKGVKFALRHLVDWFGVFQTPVQFHPFRGWMRRLTVGKPLIS